MRYSKAMAAIRRGVSGTGLLIVALLAAGCARTVVPTGRVVFCNAAGAVVHDVRFALSQPPSEEVLVRALEEAVPSREGEDSVAREGLLIQAASAAMERPTPDFLGSRTLSEFEASLHGSHARCTLLSAVAGPAFITIFQSDLSTWQSEPERWVMRGRDRSEKMWRSVLVRELERSCRTLAEIMGVGQFT